MCESVRPFLFALNVSSLPTKNGLRLAAGEAEVEGRLVDIRAGNCGHGQLTEDQKLDTGFPKCLLPNCSTMR